MALRTATLALALVLATGAARADVEAKKLACATAYEQAQRLRNADRLLAARAQLSVCSDPECPSVLRGDCATWLGEVDRAIPKVILMAEDASGSELTDVRVELDGRLLSTRLDGKPLAVDPGTRRFRFVRADGAEVEELVELTPGEPARRVRARFPKRREVEPEGTSSGVPTATWLLAGVGVAALAGFGYFALDGRAKKNDLDGCRPSCNPDDVDAARRSFVIGDVLLAVGVSALAGASIVYVTRPEEPLAPSALSLGMRGAF